MVLRNLLVLLVLGACLVAFSGCLRHDPAFQQVVLQNWKNDLYWLDHDLDWILALRRSTMLHTFQQ